MTLRHLPSNSEFMVCYFWMNPQILVYHANPKMAEAISVAVRRRRFTPVAVTRVGAALRLLHREKFPAAILDCGDPAIASDLLAICRSSSSNKFSVVFALTNGEHDAFQRAAHLCVKRSTDLRALSLALHTAEGIILREFHRYKRLPITSSVALDNDEHSLQLKTVNISEGGMCVLSEIPGWNREHAIHFDDSKIGLRFHSKSTIVWKDRGQSGIKFEFSTPASRSALAEWLHGVRI